MKGLLGVIGVNWKWRKPDWAGEAVRTQGAPSRGLEEKRGAGEKWPGPVYHLAPPWLGLSWEACGCSCHTTASAATILAAGTRV